MYKIDYSKCSKDELEDVWHQVDDVKFPERAADIYRAMRQKQLERYDANPESSSQPHEVLSYFFHKSSLISEQEEYQYLQRELEEKEQRVKLLVGAYSGGRV